MPEHRPVVIDGALGQLVTETFQQLMLRAQPARTVLAAPALMAGVPTFQVLDLSYIAGTLPTTAVTYAADVLTDWDADTDPETVHVALNQLAERTDDLEAVSHGAVTLDTNADTLLSLSTQALGLDTQTANRILAGPTTGSAAVPTFRALVTADIPTTIAKRIETATYTEAAGDYLIVCDKSTAMTVNLLAATGSGRVRIIKNIGAGLVTIDGDSGDVLDGETTQELYQWESVTLVDIAANTWGII